MDPNYNLSAIHPKEVILILSMSFLLIDRFNVKHINSEKFRVSLTFAMFSGILQINFLLYLFDS
jgi:hypothetical protein